MDFERTTTVGVGADAALDFLADPRHVSEYVPTITHVESTAVDGEVQIESDVEGRRAAGVARFFVDRGARRIEWGSGDVYGGSIEVAQGTPSTSDVTIRLHTRDDADEAEVRKLLDQTARTLGRLLSGR
jgi:carbon monoxide dehydrogenase subunit G